MPERPLRGPPHHAEPGLPGGSTGLCHAGSLHAAAAALRGLEDEGSRVRDDRNGPY